VVNEPRGSDAIVGALLLPANDPAAAAQVFFFNNVGWLGMCVHGTIGVAETLRHLGRIKTGHHRLETPVGDVSFEVGDAGRVSVCNVPSRRTHAGVKVETEHHGMVTGDIAWGGNWFFLVRSEHGQDLTPSRIGALTRYAWEVRQALTRAGITGEDGAEIDHVELFGPPHRADADSRNFVLCPGGAYDRSPCGTGTSAKMACLFADGQLAPGQTWRQESIIGSLFEGSVTPSDSEVLPTVTGQAWITSESSLILDDSDPFREGIRT